MGFVKLGAASYRYPKTVLLGWLLLLVVIGPSSSKLSSVLKGHGLLADGAYTQVAHALSSRFGVPEEPVILVFQKKSAATELQFHRFIKLTLSGLADAKGLKSLISPWQQEGMLKPGAAYALLSFEQKPYEMKPVLDELRKLLPQNEGISSIQLTGKSVVQVDVNQASQHDLRKAELIGLPIAFFILWYAFGGAASAIVPVIIGMFGVTAAMGLMALLGTRLELSNFVLNVIPMAGLALSIDFALIIVSRFREELVKGSAELAMVTTMRTAGRAVLFSAASVFLGLMGLLFIRLPIFTTVALGAMTVIAVSVLLILTLLPALLALLTPTIQREIIRRNRRVKLTEWKRDSVHPVHPTTIPINGWSKWAGFVMSRPVLMAGLVASLLLVCLLPLARMRISIPDASSLPSSYESRLAAETYGHYFDKPNSSLVPLIAVGHAPAFTKDDFAAASGLIQQLSKDAAVLRVQQPQVTGNLAFIQLTIEGSPDSKKAMDWVRRWEQEGQTSPLPFRVGGEAKYQQEVLDGLVKPIPAVITFICVSNFIVLFLAFRSVLIPLKAIAMNLLSLGASLGLLVWVFEKGHLGFEPYPIAIMIPVFVFGLVFGISMDYGVFLLSRIAESYRQTGDNDLAVHIGLSSSSRMITSAAAILIAVTLPFAAGEVVGVKQLGIGIAAAIFIDATLIRLILVPSLMKLLGGWNWWVPKWFQSS